jgi:hypothetical protein
LFTAFSGVLAADFSGKRPALKQLCHNEGFTARDAHFSSEKRDPEAVNRYGRFAFQMQQRTICRELLWAFGCTRRASAWALYAWAFARPAPLLTAIEQLLLDEVGVIDFGQELCEAVR